MHCSDQEESGQMKPRVYEHDHPSMLAQFAEVEVLLTQLNRWASEQGRSGERHRQESAPHR